MGWPLSSPEEKAAEAVREKIAEARKAARERQEELAKAASDETPEGAARFAELLKTRDDADAYVGALQSEWEAAVTKMYGGKGGRIPGSYSRSTLVSPKAAEAFTREIGGLGSKMALESPSGAVIVPSLFERDIAALPQMPLMVWPLFAQRAIIDAGSVEFLQQTTFTNAAQAVGPLTEKPKSVITVKKVIANVATIACVSEAVDKNVVADHGVLGDFIGGQLAYGVMKALDDECVNGDGPPGFVGIRQTVGVGTVGPPSGGTTVPDLLASAVSALQTQGYDPTAIVIHPTDWLAVRTSKAETAGQYLAAPMTDDDPLKLWGVSVIPTPAIGQGFGIVGDFQRGGVLYTREQAKVTFAETGASDTASKDLFVLNALRFRAEARAVLAVTQPSAFVVADLAA